MPAVLIKPNGEPWRFQLKDNGLYQHPPGTYSARLFIKEGKDNPSEDPFVDRRLPPGTYYLYVVAWESPLRSTQDTPGRLSGRVLTKQLTVGFNEPCELLHDNVINVV